MTDDNQAYSLKFARIGQDVMVYGRAKIATPEVISIGDSVEIDDFVFLAGGKKTTIGSFVHIAPFAAIAGGGELVIEDFAGVSGGTRIYTGDEHYLGDCLTGPTVPAPYRIPIRSFVHIGKHAIIGANSTILQGVTIGEGAVVGAHSLVRKDCKPWTVNVGSPVREVKVRPKERMMELEDQLRRELYDVNGRYIPRSKRGISC